MGRRASGMAGSDKTSMAVTASGPRRGFLAGHAGAVLCALGVALITLSGWCNELVAPVSPIEKVSWASWLSNGAAALSYLACIVAHRRLDLLFDSRLAKRFLLACAAIACAGRVLSLLAGAAGLPLWAACAGRMAYEACLPVLFLALLGACCRNEARWAAGLIPAGYALAAAVHLVLRVCPVQASVVTAPLLPLAAGVVFAVYLRQRGTGDGQTEARAGGDASSVARLDASFDDEAGGSASVRWTFPFRPVALMCAYAFVFNFSLLFSAGPNPYGMAGMLLVSVTALAVSVARPGRYSTTFLYRMALPLIVAGLVCLGFLGEERTAAVLFANSGNVAFALFMLITLAGLCHRLGVSPTWMFGIVQLASRLAGAIGTAAGEALTSSFEVGSQQASLAMCGAVVGIVVLSTVFFNDTVVERSFGLTSDGYGDKADGALGVKATMSYSERVVWQCSQVARRYALTLREQEVLELMVQGESAQAIAERTCISYGTVKTHVNHIYRKLDVHSRDEALALLRRETE